MIVGRSVVSSFSEERSRVYIGGVCLSYSLVRDT